MGNYDVEKYSGGRGDWKCMMKNGKVRGLWESKMMRNRVER
jgi:hypothetical protein